MIKNVHFGISRDLEDPAAAANDDSKHNGRRRSFAHERGNWATYIYIHCKRSGTIKQYIYIEIEQNQTKPNIIKYTFSTYKHTVEENAAIANLQSQMAALINTAAADDVLLLRPVDQLLHVSLTRTVVLQHHWIDSFVESVREAVPKLKRFPIHMDRVSVFCNDERTRTFVALSVAAEDRAPMHRIVHALNRCLDEFKLPPFYKVIEVVVAAASDVVQLFVIAQIPYRNARFMSVSCGVSATTVTSCCASAIACKRCWNSPSWSVRRSTKTAHSISWWIVFCARLAINCSPFRYNKMLIVCFNIFFKCVWFYLACVCVICIGSRGDNICGDHHHHHRKHLKPGLDAKARSLRFLGQRGKPFLRFGGETTVARTRSR